MNTHVSFETSKLLKEKWVEQKTKSYTEDGKLVTVSLTIRRFNPEKIYYPAPTIAEVVMWLYEKYGIWIYPFRHDFNNQFYWHIDTAHEDEFTSDNVFNSPTAAYEAAVEYTLKNLIK